MFENHARYDIRRRAVGADPDGFAFEIFDRLKLRPRDQHKRKARHIAGQHLKWQTPDRGPNSTPHDRIVIDIAVDQCRHRHIAPHLDDLRLKPLLFEEALLLRQRKSDKLRRGARDADSNPIRSRRRSVKKENSEKNHCRRLHETTPLMIADLCRAGYAKKSWECNRR